MTCAKSLKRARAPELGVLLRTCANKVLGRGCNKVWEDGIIPLTTERGDLVTKCVGTKI